MRDRGESTRPRFTRVLLEPELLSPEEFSTDTPLRETFAHWLRPEERFALEQICDGVLELTREASRPIRESIPGGFDRDLAAVVADLRYAEAWLAYIGRSEGNVLERWQSRLADLAERLAPKVGDLAGEVETALEAK